MSGVGLIEAAWLGLREQFIPPNASKQYVHTMRAFFFVGAHYMYRSLNQLMSAGDFDGADAIATELEAFVAGFKATPRDYDA